MTLRLWLAGLLAAGALAGCASRDLDVEMDTPEETAASVGRILCVEHAERVAAVQAQLEMTRALQQAKTALLADTGSIRKANARLDDLIALFETHEDELTACTVALVDLERVDAETKVHVAIKLQTRVWAVDAGGTLELADENTPVLLTLTRIDGAWRVTESSIDFTLPGGALRSLLD